MAREGDVGMRFEKKTRPVLGGCGRVVTFTPEVSTSLTRAQHARKARLLLIMPWMLAAAFLVMLVRECGRTVM